MAQTKKNSGRSSYNSRKSTGNSQRKTTSGRKYSNSTQKRSSAPMDSAIRNEIILIGLLAVAVVLFLCNFGVIGVAGDQISHVMFGLFGLLSYVVPIAFFVMIAFGMVNSGNSIAIRKLIAGVVLFLLIGIVFELFTGRPSSAENYQIKEIYTGCSKNKNGGGILAGSLAYLFYHFLGLVGSVLAILVGSVICIVIITDKSFVTGVRKGGQKVYERTREDARYRKERARIRREEQEEERRRAAREQQLHEEELENERILRMNKKVSGVMMDTSLAREERAEKTRDDMHEINLKNLPDTGKRASEETKETEQVGSDFMNPAASVQTEALHKIRINGVLPEEESMEIPENAASPYYEEENGSDAMMEITGADFGQEEEDSPYQDEWNTPVSYQDDRRLMQEEEEPVQKMAVTETQVSAEQPVRKAAPAKPVAALKKEPGAVRSSSGAVGTVVTGEMYQKLHEKKLVEKEYHFPPIELLKKGAAKTGDSSRELRETAERLRQTLQTFGVKVTITDISQGPAVTRYELQPEQGVKVSKIVGLSDDIKLNLAATDIRIEAPIPGKAAIGIEVPNKENTAVALRDLLDTKEFKEFDSRLAFAVGKDIAGKTVVTDIAKMPHMLIAGATGSGKSVCINTLIMSILYKAKPDEVKLIMVDPKVVELSVYNGIPHLLIPVVTDPKKAAAALHWGVAEMTDRYQRFADFNVRDLKGYNKKLEEMKAKGETEIPAKMPQIVIIVDELADLMMVAPGEVEESICRLAQLARAAGIHLIIATQRPSVDVITGLIKANMPSRIAFSVSSGVDSRTILDMNGAEKLLGKGDMLFYPQGYTKPARVQGAFVSDKEVSDVVDYLKNQRLGNVYSSDIEEKIAGMGSAPSGGGAEAASDRDEYFVEAGKFIIEKDKASIGMLQRMFKIGFNRAARIMDQLSEAGVVGEEEGTKPRKVLMSIEQFEQYIEEQL